MDDLKRFRVPVLILSGGEPLLRPDIFEISRARQGDGLLCRPVHQRHADRSSRHRRPHRRQSASTMSASASTGSGRRTTGSAGATAPSTPRCAASALLPRARHQGRPALHPDPATTSHELPAVLDLMDRGGRRQVLPVAPDYAGRGNKHRGDDAHLAHDPRAAMDLLFERAWSSAAAR